MSFIVATNFIPSQQPKLRLTGTPTTCANNSAQRKVPYEIFLQKNPLINEHFWGGSAPTLTVEVMNTHEHLTKLSVHKIAFGKKHN